MNDKKPGNFRKKPSKSFGKTSGTFKNSGKSHGKSGKPAGNSRATPDFKKRKPKKGAQQGDYITISDGKKKVTTRINLPSHPFAKKEVGDMVLIKGVEWYLIRIYQQGTAAYNKIYDADTQREHFGY